MSEELSIEIRGADAEALRNRVFTREISNLRTGPCSYQFACYRHGGMITDGGFASVVDGVHPEPCRYFDLAETTIVGLPVVISRSGLTNELGWEVYLDPGIDHSAVGDRIMEAGRSYGMIITSMEAFRARRRRCCSTPGRLRRHHDTVPAGLSAFVDKDKMTTSWQGGLLPGGQRPHGVGHADRWRNRPAGACRQSRRDSAGRVTSSGWSPFKPAALPLSTWMNQVSDRELSSRSTA